MRARRRPGECCVTASRSTQASAGPLQQDIDRILALGIELRLGQTAGRDFTVDGLLADGHQAVFLATGLQGGRPLPIPGADGPGVFTAIDLLRDVTDGKPVSVGRNVVVIGGGDVAFDAGRTALRLGAEQVTLTCIEDDQTMPASADEIEEGLGESIRFICSCMPTAIVPGDDGRPQRVEFTACTLGDPDERGWRPPIPLDNTFSELACDTVIFATGQGLVTDFLEGCRRRAVHKKPDRRRLGTLMTGRAGVFAGGDAASSAAWTAIEAVAAGRRAARAIHNYLRGERLLPVWEEILPEAKPEAGVLAAAEKLPRNLAALADGLARRRNWEEVRGALSEEQARAEALRCLNCAVCSECMECVRACGPGALRHDEDG